MNEVASIAVDEIVHAAEVAATEKTETDANVIVDDEIIKPVQAIGEVIEVLVPVANKVIANNATVTNNVSLNSVKESNVHVNESISELTPERHDTSDMMTGKLHSMPIYCRY